MTDLRLLSGTRLAQMIRGGELSSREAVATHIAQVRRVNPVINALVRDRFDDALREADAADARLRETPAAERASLPPLLGVPCTVKECFALTGMPNAAGLLSRRNVVATADATVVARVRAAGAIPLGVTNTSEVCMWMESNNYLYGRSNNPYDPRHIVGGSSGGEGAIIAAGASPFGIGSDIGGSIRGPAFFNGVFGHKPTGGLVPGTGQFPMATDDAARYLTTGPMSRRAEDLFPLLKLMAGPDGLDAGCGEFTLGDPASVDLSALTVLNVADNGVMDISRDLRAAQAQVAGALRARGARVRNARFAGLARQFEVWSAMLGEAQSVPFGTLLGDGLPVPALPEFFKWMLGRSDFTGMSLLLALTDRVPHYLPSLRRRMVAVGRALRDEIVEALGPRGVMLYPTYSTPAPRHYVAFRHALRLHFPFAHQGIMNVLELPATQVPLGLNDAGLPLGVQVVATHGNDHLTIAVAMELERIFGGWTPPALAAIPVSAAGATAGRAASSGAPRAH